MKNFVVIQHDCLDGRGCRSRRVGTLCVFSRPSAMFLWCLTAAVLFISVRGTAAQNVHFSVSICPQEFLHRCHCGMGFYGPSSQSVYITNCTNSDFTSANMLTKLPPETEVLIFTGNEVKDLPYNIFGKETNYSDLHTVDLSNNKIQSIKGKTFHNVGNVKKLILNDNDLYLVSKDSHPRMFSNFENLEELHLRNTFSEKKDSRQEDHYLDNLKNSFQQSSLKKLKVLNLEDNEIETFKDPEIFCSLKSLEELYLSENRLRDVDMKLSCLKDLKKLDVSHNYISFLRNETLEHLNNIPELELNMTENRFMCDCNMIEMYKWILDTHVNIVGKETYRCFKGFPSGNVGKLLLSLALQDLQCPLKQKSENNHPAILYVIVSIIFIFLAISGMFLVVRHRATLRIFIRRLIGPIRSKYASLDRREDSFMDV